MSLDAEIPEELKKRYSDFRFLGSGAMGRVYKATDDSLLKSVAIKLLLKNQTTEAAVRFQREAQAASKLRHPNLVTIMNFGSTGGDQLYLVMEYAHGRMLSSLVKKGPLSLNHAVHIISQVCDGMSHAHSLGVIHRDLKPANIIVDGENLSEATVKVVDFGIAKLGQSPGAGHTVTPQGNVLGTPLFMSPEQISSKEIDARSDIYSTGCILFYLLTGRLPHKGKSTMELMQAKLTQVAPRINEVNKRVHVPVSVEDVVARCLSVSPDDRFSTMVELKNALVHAMHSPEKSVASPEITPHSNAKTYGLIAAAFLLVLTITAGVILLSRNSEPQPDKIVNLPPTAVIENNKYTETSDIRAFFSQDKKNATSWKASYGVPDEAVARLLRNDDLVVDLEMEHQQKITPQSFRSLAKFTKLKSLVLSDSAFNDECASYLGESRSINKLNLSGTALSDRGLAFLTKIPLDDLNMESTNVTNQGMKSVVLMRGLRRVSVAHTNVDNEGLKQISKLPLRCLRVESTNVDDDGMKSLSGNNTLERFYCESTSIGEAGLRQIASCKITDLSLDGCRNVDDHCIDFITKTWPDIVSLSISDTQITGSGGRFVWRLKRLRELKMNTIKLTDEDIAPIVGLYKLEKITLRESLITDKTMELLTRLPKLRKIELTKCSGVTDNGVRALQKKLPDITIVRPEEDVKMPGFMDAFIRDDGSQSGE